MYLKLFSSISILIWLWTVLNLIAPIVSSSYGVSCGSKSIDFLPKTISWRLCASLLTLYILRYIRSGFAPPVMMKCWTSRIAFSTFGFSSLLSKSWNSSAWYWSTCWIKFKRWSLIALIFSSAWRSILDLMFEQYSSIVKRAVLKSYSNFWTFSFSRSSSVWTVSVLDAAKMRKNL